MILIKVMIKLFLLLYKITANLRKGSYKYYRLAVTNNDIMIMNTMKLLCYHEIMR